MPLEALILRRVFPVPVTDADNARANDIMAAAGEHPMDAFAWHAAIKEATGALDEVYAVIDGREVRVATIVESPRGLIKQMFHDSPRMNERINDLLDEANGANYWQRPHEVRVDLEESQMSHKTMARIAGNSFIAAGPK